MNAIERGARIALTGIRASVLCAGLPAEIRHRASIYLLVTGCNVPGATAGRVVGASKQYVSKVLRQVEDWREQPRHEAALAALERDLFGDA